MQNNPKSIEGWQNAINNVLANDQHKQPNVMATSLFPPMPWTIISHGGDWLHSSHGNIVPSLASAGSSFVTSSAGAKIASQITTHNWKSDPNDPGLANQVKSNSIFGPSLDKIKADRLLRSFSVGGTVGAQIIIGGGEGGGGVIYDMVSSNQGGYTYELGKIGLGAQVGAAVLLGAWSRQPSNIGGSVVVFQFGASFGIGALVSVYMTSDSNLDLVGFTVAVGVGAGFSGSAAYGSIQSV